MGRECCTPSCSPILLLYAVFSLYPIVETFESLFFDAKIVEQGPFVGLENYRDILRAAGFRQALGNTLLFTAGLHRRRAGRVALVLAVLVDLPWVRGKTAFKVLFFLPVVTSLVAVGYVWKWMMDPSYGVINAVLALVGIRPGPNWLSSPDLALWSLVLVNVWKWVGYFLVIFTPNLQAIDPQLRRGGRDRRGRRRAPVLARDAAAPAGGDRPGGRPGHRQLPQGVRPRLRDDPGGLVGRTELMATYVYREAFATGQLLFGFSAAASMVLFAMIMVGTVLANRSGRAGAVAM